MMVDSQGRITLGKEMCERFGYTEDTKIQFVYEGDKKFRLTHIDRVNDRDKLIGPVVEITKYRIFIPTGIRDIYTPHVLVYGISENGYIYLEFQKLK